MMNNEDRPVIELEACAFYGKEKLTWDPDTFIKITPALEKIRNIIINATEMSSDCKLYVMENIINAMYEEIYMQDPYDQNPDYYQLHRVYCNE